jgi:hypothetical protein
MASRSFLLQFLGLLHRMGMIRACIDLQVLEHGAPHAIVREHSPDRRTQGAVGVLL